MPCPLHASISIDRNLRQPAARRDKRWFPCQRRATSSPLLHVTLWVPYALGATAPASPLGRELLGLTPMSERPSDGLRAAAARMLEAGAMVERKEKSTTTG
eukprot:scaffold4545_cov111-Isochrysis_galbana.AAC.10